MAQQRSGPSYVQGSKEKMQQAGRTTAGAVGSAASSAMKTTKSAYQSTGRRNVPTSGNRNPSSGAPAKKATQTRAQNKVAFGPGAFKGLGMSKSQKQAARQTIRQNVKSGSKTLGVKGVDKSKIRTRGSVYAKPKGKKVG